MSEIRTIGVLTSGGDAPGMNAALRSVVRCGIYYGLNVVGIKRGYNGLIHGDIFEMSLRSVSDILHRGGTIIQTARCKEFNSEEGLNRAVANIKYFDIDGIVVIGGDGSFRGAKDLSLKGIPTVGIPATIDNDISCTDLTIGFDTALNTVKEAVDKLRDTCLSHERCNVVEVMGRDKGFIAITNGVANGAEIVIMPEKTIDIQKEVVMPILEGKKRGRKHAIVILAEGVGGAHEIAQEIEKATGIETRATILGHVQRGGSPTVNDRVLASRMGLQAIKLLRDGIGNRVICIKDNRITDFDIEEGLKMTKEVDEDMLELVKILSM